VVFTLTFVAVCRAVVGWATGMAVTGVYVWRKPIPTPMKVIHARMVAQAGVIIGICFAGAFALMSPTKPSTSVVNKVHFRETKGVAPVKTQE
jgi:hypothetical protein